MKRNSPEVVKAMQDFDDAFMFVNWLDDQPESTVAFADVPPEWFAEMEAAFKMGLVDYAEISGVKVVKPKFG